MKIDTALVSGRENRAFYKEGESWFCLSGSQPFPALGSEVGSAITENSEYVMLRDTNLDEIEGKLLSEKQNADALFFTLATLDEELTLSTRIQMAEIADEFLAGPETSAHVSKRLLSSLLPQSVRVARHNLTAVLANFATLHALVGEVFDAQWTISELRALWQECVSDMSPFGSERLSLEADLIDSGLFADLVRSIDQKNLARLNETIIGAADAFGRENATKTRLLNFRSKLQIKFFSGSRGQGKLPLRNRANVPISKSRITQPPTNQEGPFRPHLGALESKIRVDKQIKGIKDMLFAGKITLAESYTADLLSFQLGQEDSRYAAMSLCNLTALSVEANQFEFATMLANRAAELKPDDPVVFTSRAEVYKRRGRFEAALLEYDDALVRFPNHSYARNGKADVLHEMGRFSEASHLYHETQDLFPEDPVAFNGKIGVIRSTGKLREALQMALKNVRLFPSDAVTRGVLASVLAANGKYLEAIRHYAHAKSLDPVNTRFIASLALAKRSIGQSTDAIEYLREKLLSFPSDNHLRSTLALLLRDTEQFEMARDVYSSILKGFPGYAPAIYGLAAVDVITHSTTPIEWGEDLPESESEWIGFRTYALSFVSAGHPEEAVRILANSLNQCPWLAEKERIRTALGFAQIREQDAGSITTLQEGLSSIEDRQKQIRLLFLGHAHAILRDSSEGHMHASIAPVILRKVMQSKGPEIELPRSHLLSIVSGKKLTSSEESQLHRTELSLAIAA